MKKEHPKLKRTPFFFQVEALSFAESQVGDKPQEIQILPCGSWNHPFYGPIVITPEDISMFKQNFDSGLRKDICITAGHEAMEELPAVGWIMSVTDKGANGLWAMVEWNGKGKELLTEKAYKYFSPEFYSEYEDPETRAIHKDVLVGGALTNKPYFKSLQAIVMSEGRKDYQLFNENTMLKDILEKDPSVLTAEEKAELVAAKDQLNEEQLEKFGSVFDETSTETDEEKVAREEKEKGDANEAAGLNRDGSAKDAEITQEQKDANVAAGLNEDGTEKVDAGDTKVEISASELMALKDKANKGHLAFAEMRKRDVKDQATKLLFSETNKENGRILPKNEAKLFSFMMGLTETQRKTFAEIVSEIPKAAIFDEIGNGGNKEGTAYGEVEAAVKLKMSDGKVSYSDAVKKVFKENPDLAKRYEAETRSK